MIVAYVDKPGIVNYLESESFTQEVGFNITVPNTPEYIRTSLTGTIPIVYDAYSATYDANNADFSPQLQCSTRVFELNAESRVAEAQWVSGEEQLPVPGASRADGGSVTVPPQSGYAVPATSVGTINVNNDLWVYGELFGGGANLTFLDGLVNRLYFRAVDSAGQPVPGILPSIRWAHLPYHLSGEFAYLAPGCLTTDAYAQVLNDDPETASMSNWVTRCQNIRGDISVVEHGLNDAWIYSSVWQARPIQPYASVLTGMTNASGIGWVAPTFFEGKPGLYVGVVQADGARSPPIVLPVRSELASMEIATEPSMRNPDLLHAGLASGERLPDDDGWYWPVGEATAVQFSVRLLAADGRPLANYEPLVAAVDADTGEPVDDRIALDPGVKSQDVSGAAGLGLRKGAPANADGVSTFKTTLADALEGQCFKLQAWFKAFAPHEEADLDAGGFGHFKDSRTSVTSSVKFCARNARTLAITEQPSSTVVLGVPVPSVPVVQVTQPLQEYVQTGGGGTADAIYTLPQGVYEVLPLEVLPRSIGGFSVNIDSEQRFLGRYMLDSYRCNIYDNYTLTGGCTDVISPSAKFRAELAALGPGFNADFAPSTGYVAGGSLIRDNAEVHAGLANTSQIGFFLFRPTIPGVVPTFVKEFAIGGLTWQTAVAGLKPTVRFGAASTVSSDTSLVALSDVVAVETAPASIVLLTVPPTRAFVGEAFLVKAIVRISSGAPLRGARVVVNLAPVSGSGLSPLGFLTSIIGAQSLSADNSPPTLQAESAVAVTDERGVARFLLNFVAGPPASQTTLVVESGGVSSQRTAAITVINSIKTVAATPVTYRRTGTSGIGDPNTEAVRLLGKPPERFPYTFTVDEPITITVGLPQLATADQSVNVSWLRRNTAFRVFSQDDIDQLARQNQKLRERLVELNATAQSAIATAESSSESVVQSAAEVVVASVSAQFNASIGLSAEEYDMVEGVVEQSLLAALRPTAQQATASIAEFQEMLSLLMGGTLPSSAKPSGPGTNNAAVIPITQSMVTLVDFSGGVATLEVRGLQVLVRKPSKLYLQPVVAGIAGHVSGDIKLEKFDKKTAAAVAIEYAVRFALVLVIGMVALGNSDFHDPRVAVPISLLFIAGMMTYTIIIYRENGGLGKPNSIGTWWLICFIGVLLCTFWGVLGLLKPLSKYRFFRTFPDKRREMMFTYVHRLVNAGRSDEVQAMKTKLRALTEKRERLIREGSDNTEDAALTASAEAEFLYAQTLYHEKRIAAAIQKERSFKTHLKALIKSIVKDDPDAFYVPVRIYAAFSVSLFATIFMAVWFANVFDSLRDTVRKADVSVTIAMFNALTAMQEQFQQLTGADLPTLASQWLEDNAQRVHKYMVSLADALYAASVAGSTLGILFYSAAMLSLVVDFRAQILQARRGIWQFNEPKVAVKAAVTFMGVQISNGILTYVTISFIFALLITIIAWSLTWDVLLWLLKQKWQWLLTLILFALINPLIKLVCTKVIVAKKFIKRRYLWSAFELYELMTQVAAGLVKSLVRFIMVIVAVFFSLPRIDRSPFPAWVEYYLLLDTGSKSYQGVIVLYHISNNPVMRVAAWILAEDARDRNDEKTREARGLRSPTARRVCNRWRKALFLVQNPSMVKYVVKVAIDQKKILKLAKSGKDFTAAELIREKTKIKVTPTGGLFGRKRAPKEPPPSDGEVEVTSTKETV